MTATLRSAICSMLVAFLVAYALLYGDGSVAAQTSDRDSCFWQPEGLKRVYGSARGHHWWEVYGVDYSADGKWIVSGGGDRHVLVWDAKTLRPIASALHLPTPVQTVSFHPDGKQIVAGTSDGQVWYFDFDGSTLTERCRLTGYPRVNSVRYCQDGSRLIVLSNTKTYLYDVTGPWPIELWVVPVGGWSLDLSDRLLAVAGDKKLSIWRVGDFEIMKVADHDGGCFCVAISPDQSSVVTGGSSKEQGLSMWRLDGDKLVNQMNWDGRNSGPIRGVQFSPDGKQLASTTSYNNEILVWNVEQIPDKPTVLKGHHSKTFELRFAPDGSQLVTASSDHSLRLWDVGDQPKQSTESVEANRRSAGYQHVWYTDEGDRLLAKYWRSVPNVRKGGKTIRSREEVVRDLTNGTETKLPTTDELAQPDGPYTGRYDVYSPDGRALATLFIPEEDHDCDGRLRRREAALCGYVMVVPVVPSDTRSEPWYVKLEGPFSALCWCARSQELVTGNRGGKLQRWNARTGELLTEVELDGDTAAVRCLENGCVVAVQRNVTAAGKSFLQLAVWDGSEAGPGEVKLQAIPWQGTFDQLRMSFDARFIAIRRRYSPIQMFQFDGVKIRKVHKLAVASQLFMDEFSPDGKLLAMHSWGNTENVVGIFDSQTGERIQEWRPLGNIAMTVFSPDGSELAVSCLNGTTYVLEVATMNRRNDSELGREHGPVAPTTTRGLPEQ